MSPPKPDEFLANKYEPSEWYNRAALDVREEIDNSSMALGSKKLAVGGIQDMLYGLDKLTERPDPKPVITIYGSARTGPDTFTYQRGRYTGALAAQNGYDVMTGGGPGIMEAGNRGAYEAGGTSIAIPIRLPFEPETKGNGYATLTIPQRNFYTRMQMLKMVGADGAFVVERGGIGTGAEVLDTLTQIQTEKMPQAPVYFMGKGDWAPMEKLLDHWQKIGTISPEDRNLYKVVNSPQEVFDDLARRRAAAR